MIKRFTLLLFIVFLHSQFISAQIVQSKSEIKNHFRNGYAPGAIHFGYLIDACYNYTVSEGLIYDPANNELRAEVPLVLLQKYLNDSLASVRGEKLLLRSELEAQIKKAQTDLELELDELDKKLLARILETDAGIRLLLNQSVESLDSNIEQVKKELQASNVSHKKTLQDSLMQVRLSLNTKTNQLHNNLNNLESNLNKKMLDYEQRSSQRLIDSAQALRNNSKYKYEQLNKALRDSTKNIRIDLKDRIENLVQLLNKHKLDFAQQLNTLDVNKTLQLRDTAKNIRAKVARLNQETNTKLSVEVLRLDGLLVDLKNQQIKSDNDIRVDYNSKLNVLQNALQDSSKNIRNDFNNLNQKTNTEFNKQIVLLNGRVNETNAALQDSSISLRNDYSLKLQKLEENLQDTAKVLRKSLNDFNEALSLKISNGDTDLRSYINESKANLIKKIDSLAEVHNVDRKRHEERMAAIEKNHSVLKDTVVKMKVKLDTLNYTELNFTQTLKLKLDNVEDGATRSDNNFTDALKTKLDGIENNANNYQLPLGTHAKLGGIKLSQDFVLHNGKAYNALDANKIDRQYAKDTITKNWTDEMKDGDKWTRVRYKIENGKVDAEGNKLYDYGEWNQAYKFIYNDLETSFYEFNATDSANVILGIHEKEKKFLGEDNTMIGHNAGYTLFKGGKRNVLLGKDAGRGSENVSDNVLVGNQAGESIGNPSVAGVITGDNQGERNVAIGSKAMQGRNANGQSVAVGFAAMEKGEQNSSVVVGYKAGSDNSGINNVLIGYEAGNSVAGSNNANNIAIGYKVGYKNTYTKRNVLIGDSAAYNNESGQKNIFIGHGAGKTNTGNRNLIIGNSMDVAGDDQLLIGNNGKLLIEGDFVTRKVNIPLLSTDKLLVKTSSAESYSVGSKLVINNSAAFVGEGGVITTEQVRSDLSNAKADAKAAIMAPQGKIQGKYVSANDAILIGTKDVINNSQTFVGAGGVNTDGNINTTGELNGSQAKVKNAVVSESLKVAGLDIVKLTGGVTTERYSLNGHQHSPADINTDANNRFVRDIDISNWNNKVDKVSGKALSANDFTNAYKAKLDAIEDEANKYIHPVSHSANMITENSNRRFVSDAEKGSWNNKVDKQTGKALSSNDYTDAEKAKLNSIETGANKYIHPANHSASMIISDATHRFVTDTEKSNWNNKVDKVSGKALSTNDFSNSYKSKLDGIQNGANKYVHPSSHAASMITQDASHRFITDSERSNWNNKVNAQSGKQLSTNDYTTAEKTKLAGIQTGANKYTHPSAHSANMITQNSARRFVSDAEKSNWNNKVDKISGKGLSSNDYTTADKNKLAGIDAGANKYVHPGTHSANMITTTTNKQFVSQTEKDNWTAGQIPLGGIIMWNGTTVPDGWALCNGQTVHGRTTPDLRGRFIVGSYPGNTNYNVGKTGGSVGGSPENFSTSSGGVHNHSANTGTYKLTDADVPAHKHSYKNYYMVESASIDDKRTGSEYGIDVVESGTGNRGVDSDTYRAFYRKMETDAFGKPAYSRNAHAHSISSDGNHKHTVTVPYYVLAFIMRVK